jgi:putative intracellular protease/amidase
VAKILAVVASSAELPSGQPTGYWLEELAAPYHRFTAAGFEVDIASPRGGPVSHDPASELEDFITDEGRALLRDAVARSKLAATSAVEEVNAADYAAVFLVGGVPAAKDFDAHGPLDALLGAMLRERRPVAGVCHGVVGLTSVRGADGELAAKDHPMTGFSHEEEVALGLLPVVAVVPEARLRSIGARYEKAAEPFGACVAEGPLFITGQNPASAGPAAEALLGRLGTA